MSSFNVSYNAGGVIDRVKVIDEVKKMNLPEHVSPDVNMVSSKGFRLHATSEEAVSFTQVFNKDVYLCEMEISCEEYDDLDYWELSIDNEKICETMYTQQMPKDTTIGHDFSIFPKVPSGSELKFEFYNASGRPKKIWVMISYMYKQE